MGFRALQAVGAAGRSAQPGGPEPAQDAALPRMPSRWRCETAAGAAPRPARGGAGGPGDRRCPAAASKTDRPTDQRVLPVKDCDLFISGGIFSFFFFLFLNYFLFITTPNPGMFLYSTFQSPFTLKNGTFSSPRVQV